MLEPWTELRRGEETLHVYQSYILKKDAVCLHLQCLVPHMITGVKGKSIQYPSANQYHVAPALPIITVYIPQTFKTAVRDHSFSVPATLQTQGMDRASQNADGQMVKGG